MHIHISTQDGMPIYQQIVRQVKNLIASGVLESGGELPSIRILAEQLLVNPNTVARAYRELEAKGFVEKRSTAGTFVTAGPSPLARPEKLSLLLDRIDGLLSESHQMHVPIEDLVDMVCQRAKSYPSKNLGEHGS